MSKESSQPLSIGAVFYDGAAIALPGAPILYTVPAGLRIRVGSIRVRLTTDANVANRRVILTLNRGGAELLAIVGALAHAASVTYRYQYFVGSVREIAAVDSYINAPFPPDVDLVGGDIVSIGATSIQVGDQFSEMRLTGRMWIVQAS